ncbi:hypothetical protein U6Q21_12665, partial [Cutibacterium acnes]
DWNDHRRLLDYAFEHYPMTAIVRKGEKVQDNLSVARSFEYPLAQSEIGKLRKKIVLEDETTTSYRLGERGKLELYLDGQRIASLPLYEDGSSRLKVQEKTTFRYTKYEEKEPTFPMVFLNLLRGLFTGDTKAS